jgi:uncharacterized protein (DUF1800 family)
MTSRTLSRLAICGLITLSLYAARGDAAPPKEELARSLSASPLTAEQQIVHVLNRIGYGPRPGDVEKVKSLGLGAYISQQLNPERIDDSGLDGRLEGLKTIHMSSRELAGFYPRRPRPASNKSPGGKEKNQEPEPPAMKPEELRGIRKIAVELQQAKTLRAIYSDRQLQEVMTDFWFNHFNVFMAKGADRILTTEYEREVIRANALGTFHRLLVATAKSPAMLFYLDNWLSADPNARLPERLRSGAFRRAQNSMGGNAAALPATAKRPRGLNENYARELMELHTLGVDGGYTQNDVTEVARCFTGWTLRNPRQGGGFQFVDFLHDNGEKTVLGRRIPAGGGMKDGEAILQMLSEHPSTAAFISTKLCRRFVSDNPPEALVRRCADTFLKTKGDIRQVLAAIFTSREFYSKEAYRAKIKKPFELVVSALRATEAETTAPPKLLLALRTMGETLYGCQPPTGYPDTADAWINAGALLERVNFATALARRQLPATRTRLDRTIVSSGDESRLIADLSRELLGQTPPNGFLLEIEKQLKDAEGEGVAGRPENVATIAGLILGSAEFQKR